MKKNMMVIGMLVALLTIPVNMFAQEDSVSAKVREPRVQVIDSLHYSRGSVVSAYFGLGNSGLWASNGSAQLQNTWGFPGFSVGARYSYFFLDWLGFTTGLDYSTYNSTIKMQGIYVNKGMKTDMNYAYEHRLKFSGDQDPNAPLSTWEENEYLGMIEIPIALSFRYKPNKVGFISTLGLKMGFPVVGRYSYKGTLNRYGWSDQFNYLEKNDQYMASNESYEQTLTAYRKGTWSVINAEAFAEVGALFQVAERVDLSLSIYGGYCMNDVNKTDYNARQDLGFQLTNRAPQANMSSMPSYQGMIGTKAIDHINPWNVGVKIGVHIYCADKNDKERAAEKKEIEQIFVRDTILMQEVYRVHDTVVVEKEVVVRDTVRERYNELVGMLGKIVVYYKVGDSKNPQIQPANMLDEVARLMVANPELRIKVKGYASADGSRRYNEMLSENRAQTIASVLRKKGVSDKQIVLESEVSSSSDLDASRSVEIVPLPLEK